MTAEYSAALDTLEVGLGLSDEEEQGESRLRGLLKNLNYFVAQINLHYGAWL